MWCTLSSDYIVSSACFGRECTQPQARSSSDISIISATVLNLRSRRPFRGYYDVRVERGGGWCSMTDAMRGELLGHLAALRWKRLNLEWTATDINDVLAVSTIDSTSPSTGWELWLGLLAAAVSRWCGDRHCVPQYPFEFAHGSPLISSGHRRLRSTRIYTHENRAVDRATLF